MLVCRDWSGRYDMLWRCLRKGAELRIAVATDSCRFGSSSFCVRELSAVVLDMRTPLVAPKVRAVQR